jgi:hypothetical protein
MHRAAALALTVATFFTGIVWADDAATPPDRSMAKRTYSDREDDF